MPDQTPGAADAPPAAEPVNPHRDGAPAPGTSAIPTPPVTRDDIRAAIAEDREMREARARTESELAAAKRERDEAVARVRDYEATRDNVFADPIGHFTALGMDDRALAVLGETIMYHLVPDKAPPDHRARLVEARMNREAALREKRTATEAEAAKAAAETARRAAEADEVDRYAVAVSTATKAFAKEAETAGGSHPFPVSAAWFADDADNYTISLVQTAAHLAEAAQERGEVADLSPRAVARELEATLTKRAARIAAAKSGATGPKITPAAETGTAKPAALIGGVTTEQSEVDSAPPGAPPRPKGATRPSEAERLARAAAVAFKPRD